MLASLRFASRTAERGCLKDTRVLEAVQDAVPAILLQPRYGIRQERIRVLPKVESVHTRTRAKTIVCEADSPFRGRDHFSIVTTVEKGNLPKQYAG